jgi:hypothetical protein
MADHCGVRGNRPLIRASRSRCPATTSKVAANLSKAGWSWGCVATVDFNGRTIFVADAQRDDGKRFVLRADPNLFRYMQACFRQGSLL